MKTIRIPQTIGKNLRSVIAQELVKSPIVAVKELVSNSYDADAKVVSVEVDESARTLSVDDDGSGMEESDLEGFLRMGDSVKKDNPLTPRGRISIGNFGIAQTLLEYLGEGYSIETRKGRSRIVGSEDFAKGNGLQYYVDQNPSDVSGTKIVINGLKSAGTNLLSLGRLGRALAWEMPSQQDLSEGDKFQIFLNGEKVERISPKSKEVFKFDQNLSLAGKVSMKVFYFDGKSDQSIKGVYVYVNNRSVGEPSNFQLLRLGRLFYNRIFARVDADGLRGSISFNRGFFREENFAFHELKEWVYACFRNIRKEVRTDLSSRVYVPTSEAVRQIVESSGLIDRKGKSVVLSLPERADLLGGSQQKSKRELPAQRSPEIRKHYSRNTRELLILL